MKITDPLEKLRFLFKNPEILMNDRDLYRFLEPIIKKAEVHKDCKSAEVHKERVFEEITNSLTSPFAPRQKITLIIENFVLATDKKALDYAFKLAEKIPSVCLQYFDQFQGLGDANLFDLALFLVDTSPSSALSSFQRFNQFSSEQRCTLAKKIIEKTPYQAILHFYNFKVETMEEEERCELAQLLALNDPSAGLNQLVTFNLSPKNRLGVAKCILDRLPQHTFWNPEICLSYFAEEELRFELFAHMLRKTPEKLSFSLKNSYFQQFSFVKKLAKEDLSLIRKYMPECTLEKEEERFEIASIIAEKDPYLAAKTNFNLNPRNLPFSLFLSSLMHRHKAYGLFFNVSGELSSSIFDTLSTCHQEWAFRNYGFVGDYLNNLEDSVLLENPLFKKALAKAQKISNAEEQKKQIEWIKNIYLAYWVVKGSVSFDSTPLVSFILETHCLHQNPTAFEVLKYAQKNQKQLNSFDLPETYLCLYLLGNSLFASSIKKQKQWLETLKRQENLTKEELKIIFEILSNITKKNKNKKQIANFLTNDLFSIELLNAKEREKTLHTFLGILCCIPDLSLFKPADYSKESSRLEVALSLALTHPRELVNNIQSFSLSENSKKEIVAFLIKNNLEALITFFGKFEFEEESTSHSFTLFVLDKAYKSKGSLSDFESRLNFDKPLDLWMEEIVEHCYEEKFPFYSVLEADNPEQNKIIKKNQFHLKLITHFYPHKIRKELEAATESLPNFQSPYRWKDYWFEIFSESDSNHSSFLNTSFEKAEKMTNELGRFHKLTLLKTVRALYEIFTLLYGETNGGVETFFQRLETAATSQEVREISSFLFLKMLLDRTQWEIIKDYPKPKNLSVKMAAPYFIGYSLAAAGSDNNPQDFLAPWSACLKKYTTLLVPGKNMAPFLNFLVKLEAASLTPKQKQNILLNQLLQGDQREVMERIRLCTTLILLNRADLLDRPVPCPLVELQTAVKNNFFAIFQITPSSEERPLLEQGYNKRIQTLRDPNALISFASNLTPQEADATAALNGCVKEILKGTFHEWRHHNSPNIQLLEKQEITLESGETVKKYERLLKGWKQGDERVLDKPFSKKFTSFLKKTLIESKTFESLYPKLCLVCQFLQGEIDLTQAMASAEKDPFQLTLLQLCKNSASLETLSSFLELEIELNLAEFKATLQKWRKKQQDLFDKRNSTQPFSEIFKDFLIEKLITDGHIVNFEEKMPLVFAFLKNKLTLEKALALCAEKGTLIEKELLSLCTQQTKQRMTKLVSLLSNEQQFHNDLNEFEKAIFSFVPGSYKDWKIADTDDVSHLLLMGRETGGCLNIDIGINKRAAVANLSDGKIRLLVILNSENQIVGRAIVRLLLNDNNKPVLLLERYYSLSGDENLPKFILDYAIKRAHSLKVPLVSNYFPSDNPFTTPIHSLGSNAPFEYTDVGIGMTNGMYSLGNDEKWPLWLLYDPQSKLY